MVIEKTCKKCKKVKTTKDFHKHKGMSAGILNICKVCTIKRIGEHKKANREQANNTKRKWRKENPDKVKAMTRRYRQKNKGKRNALTAKRRATKLNATPKWLTEEHLDQIKQIYINAKDLRWEDEMNVDHIIPLQGKNVSGLHVPWNLQLLSAVENRIKGNKI
jgi:hypothetical protein